MSIMSAFCAADYSGMLSCCLNALAFCWQGAWCSLLGVTTLSTKALESSVPTQASEGSRTVILATKQAALPQ